MGATGYFYRSKFIGDGTKEKPFRAIGWEGQPDAAIFDLRPDGGATLDGGGLNACLLWVPERINDRHVTLLGEHPSEAVPMRWGREIGCDIQARTLHDALLEVSTRPPRKGWNPILREPHGNYQLSLGPDPICSNEVDPEIFAGLVAATALGKPFDRRTVFKLVGTLGLVAAFTFLRRFDALAALPATDNFNRADHGASLNSSNWTQVTGEGSCTIQSNTASGVASADCGNWWNVDAFPNDQYSQVEITTVVGGSASGESGPGPGTRIANGARTYYRHIMNAAASNNVNLNKVVAAAYTSLGLRTQAHSASGVLRLESSGSTHTLKWQGSTLGATISDSAIASGSAGILFSSTVTSFTMDNWEGGSLSAAASPPRRPAIIF